LVCPLLGRRRRWPQNVADNVKERDNHLTTGFLGTQYILPVLSDYGYHELAYQLATRRTYPSWGYMVDKGATTMWELWNSDQQGPDMNSRNHYAYGTVGEWFFGYLAGIRPDEGAPGFKQIIIAPQPAGDLAWAEGSLQTPYGPVKSRWDRNGKRDLRSA
jgi:alpha-L-rhamnosidase